MPDLRDETDINSDSHGEHHGEVEAIRLQDLVRHHLANTVRHGKGRHDLRIGPRRLHSEPPRFHRDKTAEGLGEGLALQFHDLLQQKDGVTGFGGARAEAGLFRYVFGVRR